MRVVVAPDKLKGSLTAIEVARAVAAGLTRGRGDISIAVLPVADGGDGTVEAALSVGFQPVQVDAVGPTGEPLVATYAVDDEDDRAVVELAGVVGIDLLPGGVLQPVTASTVGLGVVLRDVLGRGIGELVLGVGGSASTDGGAGMVQAMGGRLKRGDGSELPLGGGTLREVASADVSACQSACRRHPSAGGQRRGQPAAGVARSGCRVRTAEGGHPGGHRRAGVGAGALGPGDHGLDRV